MYITETTKRVRKLLENIEQLNDKEKLKFLIYIFGLLNNNQINTINETNPNLVDDDFDVFNMESIGLSNDSCQMLIEYFVLLHNKYENQNNVYIDNGVVIGLEFGEKVNQINSQFEKLNYNEKLDVFSEIIIRLDNESYFQMKVQITAFDINNNGFDMANLIQKQKIE